MKKTLNVVLGLIALLGTALFAVPTSATAEAPAASQQAVKSYSPLQCGDLQIGTGASVCTRLDATPGVQVSQIELRCSPATQFVNVDPVKEATVTVYAWNKVTNQASGPYWSRAGNIANSGCSRVLQINSFLGGGNCFKIVWSGKARTVSGNVLFGYYTYVDTLYDTSTPNGC